MTAALRADFGVLAPQKNFPGKSKAHDRRCRPFVARDHVVNVVHLLFGEPDSVPKMREAIAPIP